MPYNTYLKLRRMGTEITQKEENFYLNDTMATYDHMSDDNQGQELFKTGQRPGQTKMLWTLVAEEILIATLMVSLIWISAA